MIIVELGPVDCSDKIRAESRFFFIDGFLKVFYIWLEVFVSCCFFWELLEAFYLKFMLSGLKGGL